MSQRGKRGRKTATESEKKREELIHDWEHERTGRLLSYFLALRSLAPWVLFQLAFATHPRSTLKITPFLLFSYVEACKGQSLATRNHRPTSGLQEYAHPPPFSPHRSLSLLHAINPLRPTRLTPPAQNPRRRGIETHLQEPSDLVPPRTSAAPSAPTTAASPSLAATRRTRAPVPSSATTAAAPARSLACPSRSSSRSRAGLVRACSSAAGACPRSVWTFRTVAGGGGEVVPGGTGGVETAVRRGEATELSAAEEAVQRLAEDLQLGVEAVVLKGGVLVPGDLVLGPTSGGGSSGGIGGVRRGGRVSWGES